MAASGGRRPDRQFGDALAGSGGMADPVEPAWSVGNPVADVFPDALSALPALGPPQTTSGPPPSAARTADPPPVRTATPPLASTGVRAFRAPGPRPASTAPGPGPAPASPRPWSQFPPPGQPAAQYVPVPTSAQIAPTPGRRPTAGLGYTAGPRPAPATAPGGLVRPPAYLPKNQGAAAQLRAALRQTRQSSPRAPRTASVPKKGKASGLWGTLVALVILVLSSGLGARIISALSDVLQRK